MMSNVTWFTAISRMIAAAAAEGRPAYADRVAAYNAWEAYYHNNVYTPLSGGGQREQVNASLGNAAAADLAGLYNPVAEVVDLYLHVLGGQFRPFDAPTAEDAPTDIRAVAGRDAAPARLLPALDRIWQWSSINVAKQQLCRLPATHGTAGLRIVADNHPDPARRRVYLKPEHPRIIRDVEVDARGNVTAIELEYDLTIGIGNDQQVVQIAEYLDKEVIATYRTVGSRRIPYDLSNHTDGGDNAVYPNRLGVVPYVLVQHQTTGDAFGLNAFYRAREPIDRLNALMTHINTQVHDHVKVVWLVAAAGPAPTSMLLDGRSIAYVDTSRGTGQAPTMQPLVAPLNLADAISQARFQVELIEDRLPELKAVVGRFLSGQSGETVAQLRAPAEHRLSLARTNYEDALARAAQIGLSWGVLLGLWDLGTGQGTPEAAERAYREGREDFRFNERALLPPARAEGATPAPRPVAAPPAADSPADDVPEEMDDDAAARPAPAQPAER